MGLHICPICGKKFSIGHREYEQQRLKRLSEHLREHMEKGEVK